MNKEEWVGDLKLVLVGSISGILSGFFVYLFILFASKINQKMAVIVAGYLALTWGVVLSLIILILMRTIRTKSPESQTQF